jgi:hypothetical protein
MKENTPIILPDIWFNPEDADEVLKGKELSAGINIQETFQAFDGVFTVKRMGVRAISYEDIYDTVLVEVERIEPTDNLVQNAVMIGLKLGQAEDVWYKDNIFIIQYEV